MTSPIAVFCECSLGLILLYVAFRSRTAYHAIEDPGKKLDANWLLYVWFLAGSLGLILVVLSLKTLYHLGQDLEGNEVGRALNYENGDPLPLPSKHETDTHHIADELDKLSSGGSPYSELPPPLELTKSCILFETSLASLPKLTRYTAENPSQSDTTRKRVA